METRELEALLRQLHSKNRDRRRAAELALAREAQRVYEETT